MGENALSAQPKKSRVGTMATAITFGKPPAAAGEAEPPSRQDNRALAATAAV